jgi:hypothetical protein
MTNTNLKIGECLGTVLCENNRCKWEYLHLLMTGYRLISTPLLEYLYSYCVRDHSGILMLYTL